MRSISRLWPSGLFGVIEFDRCATPSYIFFALKLVPVRKMALQFRGSVPSPCPWLILSGATLEHDLVLTVQSFACFIALDAFFLFPCYDPHRTHILGVGEDLVDGDGDLLSTVSDVGTVSELLGGPGR